MSPKSKLEGLDLYALRRARRPALDESEDASLWARRHADEGEQPEAGETEERAPVACASEQVAQERLDEAIRQAIDMACLDSDEEAGEEEEAGDGELRLPPAPNLRILQGGAAGRPSATANAHRLDHDIGQAEARRHRRLEPDVLPEPPRGAERRIAPLLLRFAAMIGFAAIVAYGVIVIGPLQSGILPPNRIVDHAAETAPPAPVAVGSTTLKKPARLVVQNKRAFTNQPVALGISVDDATGRESLLLAGLTAGTRLSAGEPIGDTRWQIALNELRNVYMYAPKDFVGVMNTAVNLLSPTAQLIDTKPVQFAWVAPASKPPENRIEPIQKAAPIQPKDRAQEAALLKRGEDLLNIGDIAGARRVFEYLADAGNAEAALAMGATFDARFLTEHNTIGVAADDAKTRSWYRRAADLGSMQAKTLLARMAEK